ncbi:tRNA (adenosine(37)-N6)-threonylcarbamoyltransferase complex transferase subunit TsaD [Salibacter halophilus]|uniref:tRNA N6-adenosine threonylcarbamoyltransferase n=1 Tax=Salibacter halophilus TaxID=1803916 RepID=A0A6N6M8X0_9FLAO|nr:tRNA (adenosine(37)-N6)-threonylcarbamoyltransferase complex transferase subunit TsaD [Salibacter halophilus]KAB1065214.1 tRNA (adenosine(37)-N6)-threonylcarbamoyltransferase complex transferase subunit TsaD [Salibacter halophilus]
MGEQVVILGIESSCDDTSAAVIVDGVEMSNVVAGQKVHEAYGGVVPELASRAHQKHIIPVVDQALNQAGVELSQLSAIGYTRGPGLMGSLLVGGSFTNGLSLALKKPVIEVNHMRAHILAHFIQNLEKSRQTPEFPFLCLTVSGGHTQIVLVKDYFEMEVLGETKDDAAGEAFDKVAKLMGLPYPGGPVIDQLAKEGDPDKFRFPVADMPDFEFSFSGLKTNVLYKLQKGSQSDPDFVAKNKAHIAAGVQKAIIKALLQKLERAAKKHGIKDIALAGGVSANSELRESLTELGKKNNWNTFIPPFAYCTDNAAMIGITAYYSFLEKNYDGQYRPPKARMKM